MKKSQSPVIIELLRFVGRWKGRGRGHYPTILPFEYLEELEFEANSDSSLLHYEQRTQIIDSTRPSHWESGFLRPQDNWGVEISNSQNSGRVEVLRGSLSRAENAIVLELSSVHFGNDPRMVETRRRFVLEGELLSYEVQMATTTTTGTPKLQSHLEAVFERFE